MRLKGPSAAVCSMLVEEEQLPVDPALHSFTVTGMRIEECEKVCIRRRNWNNKRILYEGCWKLFSKPISTKVNYCKQIIIRFKPLLAKWQSYFIRMGLQFFWKYQLKRINRKKLSQTV